MKQNRIKFIKSINLIVMSVVVLFSSCEKKEGGNDDENGETSLIINVGGVTAEMGLSKLGSLSGPESIKDSDLILKSSNKHGDLKIDLISSQKELTTSFEMNNDYDKILKKATVNRLEDGIKFAFVLYNVTTSSYVLSTEFTVGLGPSAINSIQSGNIYRWYAYSYYSNSPISLPSLSSLATNTSIDTYADKPLLFKAGSFVGGSSDRNLEIIFNHKLSQINIEVNVKKAFAKIYHIEGELIDPDDVVKTGSFDLLTGKSNVLIPAGVGSSGLSFAPKIPGDNGVMVAKYYTADTTLSSFSVRINALTVEYPDGTQENLNSKISALPGGNILVFSGYSAPNAGNMLKGKLNLGFILPSMKIVTFSNNAGDGQYRLSATSGAGYFVRNTKWFGPNSDYVAIENIDIHIIDDNSAGKAELKAMLSTPATYPEILIIANYYNYVDFETWHYVLNYLEAGGILLHTQDAKETTQRYNPGVSPAVYYGQADGYFLSRLLNRPLGTIKFEKPGEDYCVYKFTDTPEAEADTVILKGVFGDVRPYHWGQDRSGTTYATGYNGDDVIVYSDHSQDKTAPSVPGMAFFRHKTKKYFYVGDGGFFANDKRGDDGLGYTNFPFRTYKASVQPDSVDFPYVSTFGIYAHSNSPTYTLPAGYILPYPAPQTVVPTNYYRTNGRYQVVNSMMFGNMLAWMLEQAYFFPVDKVTSRPAYSF